MDYRQPDPKNCLRSRPFSLCKSITRSNMNVLANKALCNDRIVSDSKTPSQVFDSLAGTVSDFRMIKSVLQAR